MEYLVRQPMRLALFYYFLKKVLYTDDLVTCPDDFMLYRTFWFF